MEDQSRCADGLRNETHSRRSNRRKVSSVSCRIFRGSRAWWYITASSAVLPAAQLRSLMLASKQRSLSGHGYFLASHWNTRGRSTARPGNGIAQPQASHGDGGHRSRPVHSLPGGIGASEGTALSSRSWWWQSALGRVIHPFRIGHASGQRGRQPGIRPGIPRRLLVSSGKQQKAAGTATAGRGPSERSRLFRVSSVHVCSIARRVLHFTSSPSSGTMSTP